MPTMTPPSQPLTSPGRFLGEAPAGRSPSYLEPRSSAVFRIRD